MKNKKGFVLVETIIVMSVVMIALIGIYNSYITVIKKSKQTLLYDNINDVYRLNIIRKMMNEPYTTTCNYFDPCASNIAYLFPNLGWIEEDGYPIDYYVNVIYFQSSDVVSEFDFVDNLDINYANSFNRYLQTTNHNSKDLLILRYIDINGREHYASLEV